MRSLDGSGQREPQGWFRWLIGHGHHLSTICLKPDSNPAPCSDGRARREERGRPQRIVAVWRCRKRPGKEIVVVVEGRRAKLRPRVIVMIQQIVDLREQLEVALNLIMPPEVQDSIPRRKTLTEIVDAVGLIQIVFITTCIGSAYGYEVQCGENLRRRRELQKSLADVTRHLGNIVSRLDSDIAVDAKSAVVSAVGHAVDRLRALIRHVLERVIGTEVEFGDPLVEA